MGKLDEDSLDLELEIGQKETGAYPVKVIYSVAGEAREMANFPFMKNELELQNYLLNLKIALVSSYKTHRLMRSREEQVVQEFGTALFKALFTGKILNCYAKSCFAAQAQEKRLRLKLRILAPELAALPWEFLYDPDTGSYLCLSRNTPIVRYMELLQPPTPLTVKLPLRILGVVASPRDLAQLDVESEKSRVEKALAPLIAKGMVELVWAERPTWQGIREVMLPHRGPWHVFHFIGHGAFSLSQDEGQIVLENEEQKAYLLRASRLAMLLVDHRSLRLVVLNACEGAHGGMRDLLSSTASLLVHHGIPAVLAMQYAITDRASIMLSETFYKTLAEGLPVDIAVAEARKALYILNSLEWGTPVLYMRASRGKLFEIEEAERQEEQKQRHDDLFQEMASRALPLEPMEADGEKPGSVSIDSSSPSPDAFALPTFFPVPPEKPRCQMAAYLVTNHEFRVFVEANPDWQPGQQCYRDHKVDDQYLAHWTDDNGELAHYPVVNISWYAARAYIDWLGALLHLPLRLPTSEEWALAACAGRAETNWLQQDLKAGRVNYKGTSRTITPVGLFHPNPYRLFDILGNVYEFCTTKVGIYAYGGAFHCSMEQLMDPMEVDSSQCAGDIGFRLVQELN